jgi:hypothetical protein
MQWIKRPMNPFGCSGDACVRLVQVHPAPQEGIIFLFALTG